MILKRNSDGWYARVETLPSGLMKMYSPCNLLEPAMESNSLYGVGYSLEELKAKLFKFEVIRTFETLTRGDQMRGRVTGTMFTVQGRMGDIVFYTFLDSFGDGVVSSKTWSALAKSNLFEILEASGESARSVDDVLGDLSEEDKAIVNKAMGK